MGWQQLVCHCCVDKVAVDHGGTRRPSRSRPANHTLTFLFGRRSTEASHTELVQRDQYSRSQVGAT